MPEYNPINELIKKQYEEALLHGKHRDPKTVKAAWNSINLFEKFTRYGDFKSFNAEQAKSFKAWLEKKKNNKGELLSVSTARSILSNLRYFFEWLAIHPQYIKKMDGRAIHYLQLSNNSNRAARASREKTAPTIEELEKALKAMPFETDIEKRDRAIFAFMIITCIRDDALVSLKMKDFDPNRKTVWQDPKHVRTKSRKAITTRFVGQIISSAEVIALEWIEHAQNHLKLKPNHPLFPKTLVEPDSELMAFTVKGLSKEHWANAQPVREIFKKAFNAVNLPYYNPHLFRKTICKWGLKNLTQHEFKALSQNLGHDHAMTTYNSYGKLTEDEQIEAISNINKTSTELHKVPDGELFKEMQRRMGKT